MNQLSPNPPLPSQEIGGNAPPSPIELLTAELTVDHAEIVERAADLLASSERCVITDMTSAEKATLLSQQAQAAITQLTARQKEAKRPHHELATAAFDWFKPSLRDAEAAKTATLDKLTAYDKQRAREAEVERQRLQKIADDAAAAAAAIEKAAQTADELELAIDMAAQAEEKAVVAQVAAVAPPPPIRSVTGRATHMRKNYGPYEVIDASLIPRHYLMINDAAIKAAIKGAPDKDNPGIPGIKSTPTETRVV